MENRSFMQITEAINWLKNPCLIDKVRIEKALEALKDIPELAMYYDALYGKEV